MKNNSNEEKKGKPILWLVLFIIFILIAIMGVIIWVYQNNNRRNAENSFETMAAQNQSIEETENKALQEKETELAVLKQEKTIWYPEKDIDWDALHEESEDIYAWIYVPDTTVDYPVLQHPTDNSYYLKYNLDGTKGFPGCIYTEDFNKKDFTDSHTVIYGHRLKDKTMFSSLSFFEDEETLEEDHYFYIYTEDYVYVYQVFAAYEFPSIHLLDNYDLSNEYVYAQYIKDIFFMDSTNARIANIRHDIEVTKEDKIVTLSTCTNDHDASLRFLVTGVLKNPR